MACVCRASKETILNMSHPSQASSMTWKDAPTRSIDVAGTKVVYRQLGPAAGVPVILLNHWGAVLDNFDPRIVDGARHLLTSGLRQKADVWD
jgi:hypothetical protein